MNLSILKLHYAILTNSTNRKRYEFKVDGARVTKYKHIELRLTPDLHHTPETGHRKQSVSRTAPVLFSRQPTRRLNPIEVREVPLLSASGDSSTRDGSR